MKFFSSLLVLSLGLFATASPAPSPEKAEVAARQTVDNPTVVPLTLKAVFVTLDEVVVGVTPTIAAIVAAAGPAGQLDTASLIPLITQLTVALNTASAQLAALPAGDMGDTDEILAELIRQTFYFVNVALNKLVIKLGLDGILAPLDAALSALLTALNTSHVPSLLAALQPLLIGIGGLVGTLLNALGLSGL